jgi:glycosyltransferase involved in cell wall biosynthesis
MLRIFVAHPSAVLTDHRAHGDGLVSFGFIRELGSRGHELHVAAEEVDVRAALPPNVHVHALDVGGRPTWVHRLRFMRRMRRLYRRLSRTATFDVIHQLNPVDVGLSLGLADVQVPVVLGPYVPDWPTAREGAGLTVGRTTAPVKRVLRAAQQCRAATVLVSTPAAASKVELHGSWRPRVRELSPGIDERTWRPAAHSGESQDVLFLGHIEVRKGIHVVLDAFARISRDLPGARLLVVGEGAEMVEVRRRVSSSAALARVELLGGVDHEKAVTLVQACDVCCLPSYGEPFGMTALEAMACARPVVATDAGGLRCLVPDEGGRKVPPGDADALAAALRELLVDPDLRRALGAHNRSVVEERYTWSRVVDRLEAVYAEAIREPRPRSRDPRRRR